VHCRRGPAENLIRLHKTQLASDRTSCTSALANQVQADRAHGRLLDAPGNAGGHARDVRIEARRVRHDRGRLIKAGARVVESATRIRIALASAYPDKALFAAVLAATLGRTGARPS